MEKSSKIDYFFIFKRLFVSRSGESEVEYYQVSKPSCSIGFGDYRRAEFSIGQRPNNSRKRMS
ncbi:MAG: hypothetical protein ACJA1N_001214 [Saprospiraceae bacterium]|jgi:hypothetical protein